MYISSHRKSKKSIFDVGHKMKLQVVVQGDFLFSARAPFQGQSLLEAN